MPSLQRLKVTACLQHGKRERRHFGLAIFVDEREIHPTGDAVDLTVHQKVCRGGAYLGQRFNGVSACFNPIEAIGLMAEMGTS